MKARRVLPVAALAVLVFSAAFGPVSLTGSPSGHYYSEEDAGADARPGRAVLAATGGERPPGDYIVHRDALAAASAILNTMSFVPAPTADLPENWTVTVGKSDLFVPGMGDTGHDPEGVFAIYAPLGWADSASESNGTYVVPSDIAEWLREHPNIDAGEPVSVQVGGIEGTQIDLVCTCDGDLGSGPLGGIVKLFYLGNPDSGMPHYEPGETGDPGNGFHFDIYAGVHYRFIFLEVATEAFVQPRTPEDWLAQDIVIVSTLYEPGGPSH